MRARRWDNLNVNGISVSSFLIQGNEKAANVDAKATGPVGSLLCVLTSLLNKGLGGAVNGVLNALNGLLGG